MNTYCKLCEYTYSDESKFKKHIRKTLGIENICPLTGKYIKKRGKREAIDTFWNHICIMQLDPDNLKLDPDNLDYECINNESELNVDNINKLIGSSSFTYLLTNYFEGKITKKASDRIKIEHLIGSITIELLI